NKRYNLLHYFVHLLLIFISAIQAFAWHLLPLPIPIVNTPSVCNNCLNKITPQDEQGVLKSKAPASQLDLPSEESSSRPKVILLHQNQEIPVSNHPHMKILVN